jgi:hypothetical protein
VSPGLSPFLSPFLSPTVTAMSNNKRITFRCPPDLLALLPESANERNRLILKTLREGLKPPSPEEELASLKQEILAMKRRIWDE